MDSNDEYFLPDADAEMLAEELEDRDYYKVVNAFWVPAAARWESIRARAKQADIGKLIDDALSLIEADNPKLKGILDKRYARAQLPDGKLGELVDVISSIGFGAANQNAKDLLKQVQKLTNGAHTGEYLTFAELHQLTLDYPDAGFRDLKIVSSNFTRGEKKVFSCDDAEYKDVIISDAIRMSMSILGLFKPYQVYAKIDLASEKRTPH